MSNGYALVRAKQDGYAGPNEHDHPAQQRWLQRSGISRASLIHQEPASAQQFIAVALHQHGWPWHASWKDPKPIDEPGNEPDGQQS